MTRVLALALGALVLAAACGQSGPSSYTIQASQNINLVSPDFPDAGNLPVALSCDGQGRAPSLTWSDPPPTTRSLVVEFIDTEAAHGVFAHWLVYDIPPGARSLQPPLSAQATQGRNDFGGIGYGGLCPPRGQTHIYLLLIYAVEADPTLPAGLNRAQLEARFKDNVIGMGQLEGTFSR
ncbi:MAG TPA: YbhB/YbcL family Raf kinase inhibitor-like protein [Candidatus Dormibacteraeota bacterium]